MTLAKTKKLLFICNKMLRAVLRYLFLQVLYQLCCHSLESLGREHILRKLDPESVDVGPATALLAHY